MNYSKSLIFSIFFIFLIFLIPQNNAYGITLNNYNEVNTVCNQITGTTTGLTISDGTDFDFIEGEDYLIVVTSGIGGSSTANEYAVRTIHGTTIFDGSEYVIEPNNASENCGADNEIWKYFWFGVWTPSTPTEASEDIVIEFESLDGSNLFYDHISVQIIHLSKDVLTENLDWYYIQDTTTTAIQTGWGTQNNATLNFTPENNNDNWFIMGSNRIDTGTASVNFESRMFVNGTISDFPFISMEGEDVTNDRYVHSFSRVLTLPNSTNQQIQIQVQTDASASGTNERTHSSIFALNLDKFDFYTFEWNEPEQNLSSSNFATQVMTESFTPTTSSDVFILADIGTKDTDSQEINARVQLDNTDLLSGMTSELYDFNDEWDTTDILRYSFSTITNVDDSLHTVDVDMSEADGSTDAEAIYGSLVIFSLNIQANLQGNTTEIWSWNDTASMTFDVSQNATEIWSWNDTASSIIGAFGNSTESWDWSDLVTMVVNVSQNATEIWSWNDTASMTFDVSQNATEIWSWNDTASSIIGAFGNSTESWDWIETVSGTVNMNMFVLESWDWFDGAGYGFNEASDPPIIINEGDIISGGTTIINQGVGAPTTPDSDGDGFLDPDDACPLEPEDFDGFDDFDGCPEDEVVVPPIEPFSSVDVFDLIPFEFNELDVVDEQIKLETTEPQPQVETLKIRWLGDSELTITDIKVGDSPFEIQFQDVPVIIGNNQFGLTEHTVLYTVQEPAIICLNQFTLDCLAPVTYDIPLTVTGEINGKVIITQGRLVIDNSDRLNPYALLLWSLFIIPIIAIYFWKRKRDRRIKTSKEVLKVTRSNVLGSTTITLTRSETKKPKGTTKKLLESKPTPKPSIKASNKTVIKKKPQKQTKTDIFGRKSKK